MKQGVGTFDGKRTRGQKSHASVALTCLILFFYPVFGLQILFRLIQLFFLNEDFLKIYVGVLVAKKNFLYSKYVGHYRLCGGFRAS